MNRCAFASPAERCSGRPQWHHVISQNRLKRRFPYGAWRMNGATVWRPLSRLRGDDLGTVERRTLDDILGDPRNRVWVCDHHHQKVTNARLYVDIPESVWIFAREFGLEGMLENDLDRQGAA